MSCKGTHDDLRETTEASRSGRTAMRKMVIAAAFSAAFMSGAQALEQGGTVLSVDEANKTFTCHWGVIDKTYKTTEKTVILVGQKDGTWSDLKVGASVYVSYHPVGDERVVYTVEITPPRTSIQSGKNSN